MVICAGEILLRLKAPGKTRLLQTPVLEASFGGSEFNTAALLIRLGHPCGFLTVLPRNPLGEAALTQLRGLGIDTARVRLEEGRLGLYFLEEGALGRPSQVLYDRQYSCLSQVDPSWQPELAGVRWLHLSGITPAVSRNARDWSLTLVKRAAEAGIPVSLDLNYRAKLWRWGEPSARVLREYLPYLTLLLANETDLPQALGEDYRPIDPADPHEALLYNRDRLFNRFPGLRWAAFSLRRSFSADHNAWSGALADRSGRVVSSRVYDLHPIVDRVGAGDAFGAGIVCALLEGQEAQAAVEFATALGALKHSIPGDLCLVCRAEAEDLARGEASGRIRR